MKIIPDAPFPETKDYKQLIAEVHKLVAEFDMTSPISGISLAGKWSQRWRGWGWKGEQVVIQLCKM